MAMSINTTFFQLVAAFFVAFLLAHFTTRYLERYERFPSPLVSPGPELPATVQGRDYIPHRFKPTVPPGPEIPFPTETGPSPYQTTPPMLPMLPMQPAAAGAPPTPPTPQLPYPMTNDTFLTFVTPEGTIPMSTQQPR
jgi:hypothetical protein